MESLCSDGGGDHHLVGTWVVSPTQTLLWVMLLRNFMEASLIIYDSIIGVWWITQSQSPTLSQRSVSRGEIVNALGHFGLCYQFSSWSSLWASSIQYLFLHIKDMLITPEGLRIWGIMYHWSRKGQRLIFKNTSYSPSSD